MNVRTPALTRLKPGRTGCRCAPTERTHGEALPPSVSPPWKRDLVVARRGPAACYSWNNRAPASLGPGSPGRSPAALTARRPAHHRPAPSRTVLVEDLLGGQQGPKALYALPKSHASPPSHQHSYCMYVITELGNVKGCGSASKPLTSSRKQGGTEKLLLLALAKPSWPIALNVLAEALTSLPAGCPLPVALTFLVCV